MRCARTRQHTEVCPRLLHKVSVSLSPLSRVAGRRVELIWPTRWVRRAGASDPHAGHTQRAAVLMGGHTAFSTNRHEAQPRRTSDAAEAGSVDAAHGRPVTVRQGSGHMCVCRRVRAEAEPQPARERTGSSEMPDGVGARGERQKLQRACNWKHTFHHKNLCQEKRVLCYAESDTLEASRSVTLTCGATYSAAAPMLRCLPLNRSMGGYNLLEKVPVHSGIPSQQFNYWFKLFIDDLGTKSQDSYTLRQVGKRSRWSKFSRTCSKCRPAKGTLYEENQAS